MPDSKGICVNKNWAVWFTGLPGCGKSTIADGVLNKMREEGFNPVLLRLDERRKLYIPNPEYTHDERRRVYSLFVQDAISIMQSGRCVIMDGTGNELCFRKEARDQIEFFAEVHLKCPVNIAMKREAGRQQGLVMAGLYEKALERQKTGKVFKELGEVIGIDVKFETDLDAECTIETEDKNPEQVLQNVISCLQKWRNLNGVC
ncbi:adenylylsulfate kinase [Maridesulfovibrio ferrireducens]|uniref:Adenylylsulfate kinase n=1 Tax=Maridesulfovibrio ferrireducens TaxID=246191 RepID=A0A1G9HF69_9BACT|nr:adenylyl-sulfate kinase [Maridesulfovibrio ferrireducens]SDL11557.1 adenylylsulfate kinase [Maridesulfovibrio ferrireducens]